ncbi:class I SAM-dependent methyltransferase [Dongia soli]|uniref:Class I SAM-dependent methyltransferase n=1 Tax=Dongia soli TaxID=600628 RepID=A0ABU5E8N9_9PROT|nr:class I SAM-dependent methyltransferase [Dongia soli]MDY0882409.1 class I SAM-dependent methyltransferase [Dongia soli]
MKSDQPSSSRVHQTVVAEQFGPRAAAYVTSAVHAQGEDLQQMAGMVMGIGHARVLDLGSGGGHVSFQVAPHVREVVAYDLSQDMLDAVAATATERGLENIKTERGAAEKLPFEDGSFGFVMSRFSAHHWHDLDAALREARRVVRPCGRAVFADVYTPGHPLLDTFFQTIEMLRDPSHVRNYTIAEWERALKKSGFAPGEVTRRRLRLEFTSWVTRMQTPEVHVQAIRSLQQRMADDVTRHFEIEADGSFTIDTMTMIANPV